VYIIAKYVIFLFGLFIIGVGFLMMIKPNKAREILKKAASTNLIHFTELTVRMIPAAAIVIYADVSKYPLFFKLFGWFMIGTSLVLYFVPREYHHKYALCCAKLLKPLYIRLLSPFSFILGGIIIYITV